MDVSSTTYWVIVDPGQPVEMPNGAKGMATMRVHGTSVRSDGVVSSQWCTGHQGVSATGAAGGAGYCTLIADNGDMLYISFMTSGADGKGMWSVMGGTGGYAGATGGGTTANVSERADGRAWTSSSKGTITTS
ncbi:MAG: hypothetical protein NWP69_01275 [Congregibacter sp.]|nr:hypothetical protein [Congregibacter sp.]MDP5069589.1 hypothetical protein [Congregibacter sp.]